MAALSDQQQRWITKVRDVSTLLLLAIKEADDLNREYVAQGFGTPSHENELTEPLPGHDGIAKSDCITFVGSVYPALSTFITTHKETLCGLRNNREHL